MNDDGVRRLAQAAIRSPPVATRRCGTRSSPIHVPRMVQVADSSRMPAANHPRQFGAPVAGAVADQDYLEVLKGLRHRASTASAR
jgi:hypothetical protein